MCFDSRSSVPPPPRHGQLAHAERLVLSTDDGAQPAASLAITSAKNPPGVVILPDRRGLHPYYERLAEALAGAGVSAVAVDCYFRTAGTAYRDDDFDFFPHFAQVSAQDLSADAHAGAGFLRASGIDRVYTIGFCLGGWGSLLSAAVPGWAGVVGFYGFPQRETPEGRSPLSDATSGSVVCPVLAIFGATDTTVGTEAPGMYEQALAGADAEHRVLVYPDAGHSFFDRFDEEQGANCAGAWREVLAFIR